MQLVAGQLWRAATVLGPFEYYAGLRMMTLLPNQVVKCGFRSYTGTFVEAALLILHSVY